MFGKRPFEIIFYDLTNLLFIGYTRVYLPDIVRMKKMTPFTFIQKRFVRDARTKLKIINIVSIK